MLIPLNKMPLGYIMLCIPRTRFARKHMYAIKVPTYSMKVEPDEGLRGIYFNNMPPSQMKISTSKAARDVVYTF